MSDFSYIDCGLFTSILPNNEQAKRVWVGEIGRETEDTGKVLSSHFPSVKQQIEAAGYTITKSRRVLESDEQLLADLIE